MKALANRALPSLLLLAALAGCGATDPDGAADAAERLYAAHADRDGAAACAMLTEDTREQLVQDEGKPCEEAVLSLKLSGERASATDAAITEAKVDLDGGDSVFVEETPEGWRVGAAGCKPVPDEEAAYDCEVESR
jgi:hypothetical protein